MTLPHTRISQLNNIPSVIVFDISDVILCDITCTFSLMESIYKGLSQAQHDTTLASTMASSCTCCLKIMIIQQKS